MSNEAIVPKRALMLVPALSMVYGGPSLTSVGLASALCDQGVQMDIATTNADGARNLDVPLNEWITQENYRVRYFPRWGPWEYKFSPALARWLWRNVKKYDIIHTTSVFNFPVLAAAAIGQMRGVPYVINPAGMLEPWALAYKAWKKRGYYLLFEKPRLQQAGAIHCLSVPEARRIVALGIRSPMVVVPNGINPAQVAAKGDPEIFFAQYPALRDKTLLLFLHRVDRKKGLDLMARALASVRKRLPTLPIHLVVAGPPTDDFLSVAQGFFEEAGCTADVTFTGMLGGAMKDAAFAAARIFVTPTYSEGFSMSVLEAMAASLPSVLTTGCNFPEAEEAGAARITPIESEPFADALVELLTNPEAARVMGQKARQLVLDRYTWAQAARRTVEIYTALLNHTALPYGLGPDAKTQG
jgi:glycosyltransferase involved in cell wall biosynthesis